MKLKIFFFSITFLCFVSSQAQYGTGALFSNTKKSPFEKSSALGYSGDLPASASLKMYTPYAKNQGQYGTCTAWGTLYSALTTAYARQQNITDRNIITGFSFCPFYVYNQVNADNTCQNGMGFTDALLYMMDNGAKRFYLPAIGCGSTIDDAMKSDASHYKIKDAFIVYDMPATLPCDFTDYLAGITCYYKNKPVLNADIIKGYLADGYPVLFAMFVPNSFFAADGDYWESNSVERNDPAVAIGAHEGLHQQHAMSIVGYDDKKYGGAFEIMNSWGGAWGDKGFVWVKYDELIYWMYEAYTMELFEKTSTATEGCVSGDCTIGYGTYQFANGQKYEGHFKDGVYSGAGIYSWPDGNVYAGNWENGKRNGNAIQYFPDGTYGYAIYENDVQVGGYSNWTYDAGEIFYGSVTKGNMYRDGFGTFRWANGDTYSGGWENNVIEGLGIYTWSDGSYYIGEYNSGQRNGVGIYVSTDATIKAGNWSYDAFKSGHQGFGFADDNPLADKKLIHALIPRNYATADCKFGDCLVGDGNRVYSDGSTYNGEFKDGVEDGYGTMSYADGTIYTGHWKQGSPDGVGRFEYPNGANIIVNYVNGKIDGYVLQYDDEGSFLVQYYDDDVYIRDVTTSLTLDAYAKKPAITVAVNPKSTKAINQPLK